MQAVGGLAGALLLWKFWCWVDPKFWGWVDPDLWVWWTLVSGVGQRVPSLVVGAVSTRGCCPCGWVLWEPRAGSASASWAEAVKSQGIIFSLISRGKAAYAIVLSVSAFPPTGLLSTSFEPLVKFTKRDRELPRRDVPARPPAN